MLGIDVAKLVVKTGGAHVFRPRLNQPGEFDAKPWATGNHRGWVILDLFSASMITQVYDNLKPDNQEKLAGFIAKRGLVAGVNLGWKVIKAAEGKEA